jgi:glycosyltransferase involved in cell wall biosynthesis
LPPDVRAHAARLGVAESVLELPFLAPAELAAVYRRAAVVLLPSDAEGFGLPVIEAFACGTPVIANDLAVLRETGGTLARYHPNENVAGWADEVLTVVQRSAQDADRWKTAARAYAARFTWEAAAQRLLPIYRELDSQ